MLQSPSLERPFQITQIANGHSQAVRETHDKTIEGVTRLAIFQKCLAALPLETYQAGQTVIAEGSRTGRLLILAKGKVAIVKEDTEIATVAEPGALFGELSALLDQPHTADVRALETSQFHVAYAGDALNRFVVGLAYCLRMSVSYLSYLEWALEVWGLQHGTTSWCAVNRTHSRISDYLATNGFS